VATTVTNFPCYVALSFDDGTIKQYHTIKTLSKFGINCTIFCITHLKKHPHRNEQLLASEPEKIKELHRLGHEIGSHSCTHPDLRLLTSNRLEKEVKESKDRLENIVNDEIFGFAYPYSLYNARVFEEVKKWYFYARGGGYASGDPWNVSTYDQYRIGSVGVKKTLTLPFKIISHPEDMNKTLLVIVIHDVPITLIFSLVCYLKTAFRAQFVTMKEVADRIIGRN